MAGADWCLIGSAVAGMVARVPMHPIDTCKAKIQVQKGSVYRGLAQCLRHTFKTEGLRGLYSGLCLRCSCC